MAAKSLRLMVVPALLILLPLTALAATVTLSANPGVYTLTPETEWDKFKNDNRYYSRIPLFAGKPDRLRADLPEKEAAAATYGFLRLGTGESGVYVVFGRAESDCVDFLYVDANNNLSIEPGERVEIKKNSPFVANAQELQWSESAKPVLCDVSYRRANGTFVTMPVAVEFNFLRQAPQSRRGDAAGTPQYLDFYLVDTWFSGTVSFQSGKNSVDLPIALIDGNDNGIFNEYGRDQVLIDTNNDGYFDLAKEMFALNEFELVKTDGKNEIQLRKAMFAWPVALRVQPVGEVPDRTDLEPQ